MNNGNYWDRVQRERISRRRLLVAAQSGAVALAFAAACGGGGSGNNGGDSSTIGPGATPDVTSKPKRGGRSRSSVQGDWGTVDPVTSVGNATGILPRMYNTLFSASNGNPDFIFMDLAEKLEQPDGETYVFTIRPGVKIGPNSLGIPERDMDVSDIESWLRRVKEDKNALPRAFTEPFLASSRTTGANTFEMKTPGPYAYFSSRLGRALGGCIPPKEFWENGISSTNQGIGGGPFMLTGYEESGNAVLQRNPNYYRKDEKTGEQLPYVDGIDVARITDRQARRAAFLDKQIYSYDASTIDEAKELQGRGDMVLGRNPSFTFIAFTMNPTRDPWKDDRLRKAALYALDRKQFIDLIVGEGEGKADGLVHWPAGPYAFDEQELEQYQPYDPKKSRDLIKAATGQDTIKVKITYPISDIEFHDQHLPIFLRQMKEAGFDVQEEPMDFSAWLAKYTDVDYDASFSLNQIYETAEIPLDWHASDGPQGDGNFATGVGTLYPEVDEAILNSKRAPNREEHIKRVRDTQALIYDKGPAFLPIFSWYTYSLRWGFVKGVLDGLGDTGTFLSDFWLDL
jgi:peptide/nickel transport system substrate-binding protein